MAHIYAMSDIHEELDLFKETLSLVDFSKTNQLILVGDYVDIHSQNLEILYFIKELQEKHPAQITVIAGNHELMLLEEIDSKASLLNDITLIKWLRDLPFYYETDKQIFVHAGIDEEAEELWKWGSEDYYFCSKYPHTTGAFFKDIIAGHISTSEIAGEVDYHKVYWDKQSHFYIDGDTRVSKAIPVLKYDTTSGNYSGFEKIKQDEDSFVWREYLIKQGE
ncbi:metallophosphoesterase [Paenibacillus sp. FSL L8-0641]|uniref:metallophosphoesterase n=1 Tax=Paenibacillus sp. FSL L8-0641 TaxID=2921605 RepID=UPI0030F5246B